MTVTEYTTSGARTRATAATEAGSGYVLTKRELANEWMITEGALEWRISAKQTSMMIHNLYTVGELHMAVTAKASMAHAGLRLDLPSRIKCRKCFWLRLLDHRR